jgi:hypothetical protein
LMRNGLMVRILFRSLDGCLNLEKEDQTMQTKRLSAVFFFSIITPNRL